MLAHFPSCSGQTSESALIPCFLLSPMLHPSVNLVSSISKITYSLTISFPFLRYSHSLSHHCLSVVLLQTCPYWSFCLYPLAASWSTQNKIQSHSMSYKTPNDSVTHTPTLPPLWLYLLLLPLPLPCPHALATLASILFLEYVRASGPLHLLSPCLRCVPADICMARYFPLLRSQFKYHFIKKVFLTIMSKIMPSFYLPPSFFSILLPVFIFFIMTSSHLM